MSAEAMAMRLLNAIRVDERRLRMMPGYRKHYAGECGCDPDNGAWCRFYTKVHASDLDSEYLLALSDVREAVAAELDTTEGDAR